MNCVNCNLQLKDDGGAHNADGEPARDFQPLVGVLTILASILIVFLRDRLFLSVHSLSKLLPYSDALPGPVYRIVEFVRLPVQFGGWNFPVQKKTRGNVDCWDGSGVSVRIRARDSSCLFKLCVD
jgi:hypothetical protein